MFSQYIQLWKLAIVESKLRMVVLAVFLTLLRSDESSCTKWLNAYLILPTAARPRIHWTATTLIWRLAIGFWPSKDLRDPKWPLLGGKVHDIKWPTACFPHQKLFYSDVSLPGYSGLRAIWKPELDFNPQRDSNGWSLATLRGTLAAQGVQWSIVFGADWKMKLCNNGT